MTEEQIVSLITKHDREIAGMNEKLSSAHKRIDENDKITNGIYKLATNVETLALQVKMLTDKMDQSLERLEAGLKSQGERIGTLEKEPATKWKNLGWLIIAGVVTAIVGFFMAKVL